MKRSGKFYRKNETEVMKELGLKPTKNSGSGWIEKEDGQNDYVICQLKSTDAESIRIQQKDIRVLEENAAVCHKLPLFVIQFLNTNEIFLLCKPEDMCEIVKYIETGKCEIKSNTFVEIEKVTDFDVEKGVKKIITSSADARESYHSKIEKLFDKTKGAL